MVDSETIETKFSEKKEEFEESEDNEKKFDEKKERKTSNVANDFSKTIDEIKESLKSMQKAADQKFNEYKQTTVQSLDIDLIETDDVYYLKVAVPGIEKEEIDIEAGDNDIKVETTFKPYLEEFEEDEATVIVSNLKKGRCVKTIRFETSINVEEITARLSNGALTISAPKLVIPKHKVNVE